MTPRVPLLNTATIRSEFGEALCASSLHEVGKAWLFLLRNTDQRVLCVLAEPGDQLLDAFNGTAEEYVGDRVLLACPTSRENCRALREVVPSLRARTLGLRPSFGFGDRLGMATPGHVRALDLARSASRIGLIMPVFAQQSVRENTRTGRSPQDVMDDATWGAFEGGWNDILGADADHLKTLDDIDSYAEAGYSLFTIDPGEFVDAEADKSDASVLRSKVEGLPWKELETSEAETARRYSGVRIDLGHRAMDIDTDAILIAAAKYGRAVAHVVELGRHLAAKSVDFELEISVDETETPTSPVDHFYVASELKRLGVRWVSLAPRYVGSFEKAIDYRGDLSGLRMNLLEHAHIAAEMGPYKLGLHSGSDKFSVYPLIREATGGLCHVKTAGTSYMEALRVVAGREPKLFREIVALAASRFAQDRSSYHLSTEIAVASGLPTIGDPRLATLLDEDGPRQVLHVTFGSILNAFGEELKASLARHLEDYYQVLETHFLRHLKPLW